MRHHEPTRASVERRTNEGLNKREIIRCVKRYIAREIYANLPRPENNSTAMSRDISVSDVPRHHIHWSPAKLVNFSCHRALISIQLPSTA